MKYKVKEEGWYTPKGYIHFDFPLLKNDFKRVEKIVSDPKIVAKHSFYPFITFEQTKYKMYTDEESGRRYLDDDGIRPLSYAAHLDSQIYSYYSVKLGEKYEQALKARKISDNVIAFRKLVDPVSGDSKCNIHLANEAFEEIKRIGSCRVYAFDIKSFFDKLNHIYLRASLCKLLGVQRLPDDVFNIYRSLTTHSIVYRKELYDLFSIPKKNPKKKGLRRICSPADFRLKVRAGKTHFDSKGRKARKGLLNIRHKGIPQGSPISALLANVYMMNFDEAVNSLMKKLGGSYFRYCDDIMCIIPIENDFDLEKWIDEELSCCSLWLNQHKTEKRKFTFDKGALTCDHPIQYLGFVFDGSRKYIRPSSIGRYRRKARKAVRLSKATMVKRNQLRKRNGEAEKELFKKKLLTKYFHTGKRNFISYGYRAAMIMRSHEIRRQMRKMNKFLIDEINSDKERKYLRRSKSALRSSLIT